MGLEWQEMSELVEFSGDMEEVIWMSSIFVAGIEGKAGT
jgi:hypothetical protein